MTVIADNKKRVVLPGAKPGDVFDVQDIGTKKILTLLKPVSPRPAKVTIKKDGGYSVGKLDRAIDNAALKEALAEFP